jgi:hypothetical protein
MTGYTRADALRTQIALTDAEIAALVERCPPEHRWAFEGWLNGTRQLDGDPIPQETRAATTSHATRDR